MISKSITPCVPGGPSSLIRHDPVRKTPRRNARRANGKLIRQITENARVEYLLDR